MEKNKSNTGGNGAAGAKAADLKSRREPFANPSKNDGMKFRRYEDQYQLTRRYSIDDNGGGYIGL